MLLELRIIVEPVRKSSAAATKAAMLEAVGSIQRLLDPEKCWFKDFQMNKFGCCLLKRPVGFVDRDAALIFSRAIFAQLVSHCDPDLARINSVSVAGVSTFAAPMSRAAKVAALSY